MGQSASLGGVVHVHVYMYIVEAMKEEEEEEDQRGRACSSMQATFPFSFLFFPSSYSRMARALLLRVLIRLDKVTNK